MGDTSALAKYVPLMLQLEQKLVWLCYLLMGRSLARDWMGKLIVVELNHGESFG